MTPEQQRIKIAEALGIPKHARFYALDHGGKRWWTYTSRIKAEQMYEFFGEDEHPIEEFWKPEYLPDYLNDLNAMHEAEKVLTDEQLEEYFTRIHKNFSASQRAEAFLRTFNLWKP